MSGPDPAHGLERSVASTDFNQSDDVERPTSQRCAFWNVNVHPSEQTTECPHFLAYACDNEKDRNILATPDDQYRRMSWGEVVQLIRENRLDLFTRVPSELRLYREYCAKLIRDHGSIMTFVLRERLRWADLEPLSPPFEDPAEYRILYNDWPYGIDERIVHLVVWTKFELPADPASDIGDMSSATQQLVDDFVRQTFGEKCAPNSVIWFKNWAGLKSIHAVEHFHVMLFAPTYAFVQEVTHGDVPLSQKVKRPAS